MFSKRQHNTKKCVDEMPKECVEVVSENVEEMPKECVGVVSEIFLLPDDILEMCLNRVPLESLKNARLVCKKWSSLITNPKLIHMRNVGPRYQNLWLFVFRTPYNYAYIPSCSAYGDPNMILALDLYRNQWHNIDATFLKGRFMFSTASIHNGILIVGGNSHCRNTREKTVHNEVMSYNAVAKSWHNMPSMKYARSLPVLGVTEDPIIRYKYSSLITSRRRSDHSTLSSKSIKRSFLLISVGGFNIGTLLHYGSKFRNFL
ncbi:F-box/kelch-repeat protein [Trifolium medium]|uniref:F-box/kelch-repeat protein n=1 Tax=Trifolium medium TaxID=97028 RepID=A0A392N447_9FABA|nr:F-box/kelch-repeat protein [Trifolium medium]